MKSNYKKLGQFIEVVNIRNTDLAVEKLLGVSIRKVLMPSIANTIGTNMKTYKIIKRNQFAYGPVTSRNGDKISIALLEDYDDAIISQAYVVFEIIDKTQLLPEYAMMWFRRPEFDRYARFKSHGSARETFDWDELCETELPIPSIEKQREIVAEYNTITNRIALNDQLNQKLEETAQALYKHWFVDFEFPNGDGQPYKSSGGEMVYNEELDIEIPEGWEVENIESICEIIDGDRGKNYPSQQHFSDNGYCLFLNAGNVSKIGFDFSSTSFISKDRDELLRKGKLERNDTIVTTRGTVGNVAFYGEQIEFNHLRINSGMVIFRTIIKNNSLFIYSLMRSTEMKKNILNYMSGSAQPQLPIKDIKRIPILVPNQKLIIMFSNVILSVQNSIEIKNKENRSLFKLKELVLSKMTKVEVGEEIL